MKQQQIVNKVGFHQTLNIVELQWLEYLLDHENMFETGVVRVNEC